MISSQNKFQVSISSGGGAGSYDRLKSGRVQQETFSTYGMSNDSDAEEWADKVPENQIYGIEKEGMQSLQSIVPKGKVYTLSDCKLARAKWKKCTMDSEKGSLFPCNELYLSYQNCIKVLQSSDPDLVASSGKGFCPLNQGVH
eukprot:sb/3474067/